MVFAASSFQWLSSDNRLKMIAAWVKSGGGFARFKTVTVLQSLSPADKVLYDLYQKFLPDFLPKDTAHSLVRKKFFKPVKFRRDEYIAFVNTYTEYLNLPMDTRINFENAIKEFVTADDSFNLQQKCSLVMARKIRE